MLSKTILLLFVGSLPIILLNAETFQVTQEQHFVSYGDGDKDDDADVGDLTEPCDDDGDNFEGFSTTSTTEENFVSPGIEDDVLTRCGKKKGGGGGGKGGKGKKKSLNMSSEEEEQSQESADEVSQEEEVN